METRGEKIEEFHQHLKYREPANFAATNPTTTFRNRWIATRYYSVRNHVRNLHLLPTPVPTSLNVADLFTKAIPEFSTFDKHRRACGLIDYEDGA